MAWGALGISQVLFLPLAAAWWCAPDPGRCHGHREKLVKRASVRMAARLGAPYVVDWDEDGNEDLLIGDHDGRVRYYSRKADGRYYVRKASEDPFQAIKGQPRGSNYSAASPVAVDFDGDGKLDLLLSVQGRLSYFHQQNGTLVKVDEGSSPFRDIRCSWLACRFHAADWDADGDIDLVVPQGLGLLYFENVEGVLLPRTGSRNPFQYVVTKFVPNHRGWDGMYSSPFMVDWDGDGDMDLLVGQTDGSLLYFERAASGRLTQLQNEDGPFQSVGVHSYPSVHAAVLDGHKRLELLVGDAYGRINLYWRSQDMRLKQREGISNPFALTGRLQSAVPAWPLVDENGDVYLMFQQENVGRVQLFRKMSDGTLKNITTNGTPQAAATARWLQAGRPVDVDWNQDGALDRLTIFHSGRIDYLERNNGILLSKNGIDSPFYGLNLANGVADSNVSGFLPIDWNGDGNMDLIVGAWGESHLKYFQAGYCTVPSACSRQGICGKTLGGCTCMTGRIFTDCSGCGRGYFSSASRVTSDYVGHDCKTCPGLNTRNGACSARGLCYDDMMAAYLRPDLNRAQKAVLAGNGSCSCSPFFSGEDCAEGVCPPGYQYDSKRIVARCEPCNPGFYKPESNNFQRCGRCPSGRFAEHPGTAVCSWCNGRFLLHQVSKDGTECITSLWANLPTLLAVLLWSLSLFLALLCRTPRMVLDVRRTLGEDGHVRVQTSGRHFILWHKHGVKVEFSGTGVPQLDKGLLHRARVYTGREVEILHGEAGRKGECLNLEMASSSGHFKVSWRHSFMFLGIFQLPFLLWILLLQMGYGAFMALFWRQYLHPLQASCLHLLLGALLALLLHWIRSRAVSRTELSKDVQVFDGLLRRRHPRAVCCEKGPQRAIEAQQLHEFLDFFRNYIGQRTTYYVVHNIILPLTEPYRLSYSEVAGPSMSTSRWFVSHYWGTPFAHLVTSVERHAQDFPEKYPYWICTFSNNQWAVSEELGSTYHESSFYQALRGLGTLGTVMVFDEEAMPLTRSWCLFELLQTVLLQEKKNFQGLMLCSPLGIMNTGKGSLDLALNVSKKLAVLDLEAAQATSQSDKDMIDNLVREEGGFAQINEFLADSVKQVLGKLRDQFTKNIDSLEQDLARKKDRAASERLQLGFKDRLLQPDMRRRTEPLPRDFGPPQREQQDSPLQRVPMVQIWQAPRPYFPVQLAQVEQRGGPLARHGQPLLYTQLPQQSQIQAWP